MTAATTITACDMNCPSGWAPIPASVPYPEGWDADWDAALAEELAPRKARRLRKAVRRLQQQLTTEPQQMIGVWVREPDSGEITGHVTLNWLLPGPGEIVTRDYYRSLLEPDRRTGITVFARNIDDIDVPAGPALQIQEIVAPAPRGAVEERLKYVVFPPDCDEAISVEFVLHGMQAADDFTFEEHALASLATLTITIGTAT